MAIIIKLYEVDHFYKKYEDYKNNLYMLELNDKIIEWLDDNMIGSYDIDEDDYDTYHQYGDCDYIYIIFTEEADAVAFKLRWL
jgi:hypothetical protein